MVPVPRFGAGPSAPEARPWAVRPVEVKRDTACKAHPTSAPGPTLRPLHDVGQPLQTTQGWHHLSRLLYHRRSMTPRGFEPLFIPSGAIKNGGSEQTETAVSARTQPACKSR